MFKQHAMNPQSRSWRDGPGPKKKTRVADLYKEIARLRRMIKERNEALRHASVHTERGPGHPLN